MDLPATYYGDIDKRNPVILCFERDIKAFTNSMKRVASSATRDNVSYTKGIKTLVDLWRNYKHRLPSKLYQQSMLHIADFLAGLKMFRLALWQGYSLHLYHFSAVDVTDITDMEHFMACFFPQGFDADTDIFDMKVRAMLGCAHCIFEQEKKRAAVTHMLSQKGLSQLLQVLNFLRSMMQAFQRPKHLCLQLYNGTLHIYNICRYLMTMTYSGPALEYLLWASTCLEQSVPLRTAKYVPWISTLYCAVCQCYYANHAAAQAEKFARRCFERIMSLAEVEKDKGIPSTRETQKAYKEGSIKLVAMIFKRVVFEMRKNPEMPSGFKTKSNLKDIPHGPWPCTATERLLSGLFDSNAAQFLGILEALWDSSVRPLQMAMPEEPEMQEVVLELVSAGISLLYGGASASSQRRVDRVCLRSLTSTSSLMELALTGENKIPIMSAVRFTKIVFQYNQPDVFTELAREIVQVLSTLEGHSFRKAELELVLLGGFNTFQVQASKKTLIMESDRFKASFTVSNDFLVLVDTLHKSLCDSPLEAQPDENLVLDLVLFVWKNLKGFIKNQPKSQEYASNADKLVCCLSMLCEVAFACDLATVDCMMTAEMIHTLAILLEGAAQDLASREKKGDDKVPPVGKSCIELLQKVCDIIERGLKALAKGVASMLSFDFPTAGGSAPKQSFGRASSAFSLTSPVSDEGDGEKKEKEDAENNPDTDVNDNVTKEVRLTSVSLLAIDVLLELNIIHHRASLKLLQLNAVAESDVLDRIKKNKVSKAHYLIQKALVVHNNTEPKNSGNVRALLKEATTLVEKAEAEERKMCLSSRARAVSAKDKAKGDDRETPPPPPILISRTDHSFVFSPAPYHMEAQVWWYQLCGCVAEGINLKVRLGDCGLPGTGNLVPARHDRCLLKVDGLEPNKKYVFAVAAYDSQGILLGKAIGETTFPLLASTPPPLLSTWAHLAQVAFQTEQYAIAKRACKELWSHYTTSDSESHSTQDRFASTGLHMQKIQCSTPQLCQLFLTTILIETAISIQQEPLFCDSDTASTFFIWEQEARLAECERMLVATDLALWLDDKSAAVHAVISCYGLLAPLIFHQSPCVPVVQALTKCLVILEEGVGLLRYKWNVNTRKSIVHMIACMTYYVSGSLHTLKEHQKGVAVMDCGRTVLQVACYGPQTTRFGKAQSFRAVDPKDPMNIGPLLRALRGKNKKPCVSKDNVVLYPQTDEESATLHERITNGTIREAYQSVMKLKHKARFIEFAIPLLQKALREGRPDLVLKWGRTVFKYLSRSDRLLVKTSKKGAAQSKQSSAVPAQLVEPMQPAASNQDDTKKKSKAKSAQKVRMNKELQAVRKLLNLLSQLILRRKRMLQLRTACTEERVWKSHLNFSIAQAHVTFFYRGFKELHGADPQHSYRQMNLQYFSLAYSGILVHQRGWQPPQYSQRDRGSRLSSPQEDAMSGNDDRSEPDHEEDANDEGRESCGDDDDSSQFAEQHSEQDKSSSKLLLDTLKKSALHFQRAMVLAHRGAHWTTLQSICQTVWAQSRTIATLGQMGRQLRPPSLVTLEELCGILTPLLVTAVDLIMDMLNSLGLWSVYDNMPEEETESTLHFSPKIDDSTQVDMHWVRNLVLYTLEQLHDCGKWESLAHYAMHFNSYTKERYAWIVTPLLILAQRKLIERISNYGGPPVPQPHYVTTQNTTGKKITCRDYKECQLLSGWIVNLRGAPELRFRPPDVNELKESEMQRSLALVRIPLDVDDTIRCYRQTLEKRPHYLHVLQHCRSLLLLLLANTQPCFGMTMEQRQSRRLGRSGSAVDFCPIVMSTPNAEPSDLTDDDYNTPNSFYSLPLGPGHIPTAIAAYSSAIRYLKVNRQDSLRILALHEMGNLQLYSGNKRAAHVYWNRAIGNALQCTDVLEKWDGVSFGDGTLQQTLRRTGIWGCLQAAVLTAKIAQYLITSDISQRTRICLLSAHLFKCVLCCSLAQPQSDLEYASHSVGDELLPGVDLFSELYRAHIDTTVGSLNFICQWLSSTGYHIKVLPIVALYLHFVGTVCRDVQRTMEGKILKIHALTQLCLFTDAVKEVLLLVQGAGVFLPTGYHVCRGTIQPLPTFYSNKSLVENTEALEELVNCDLSPELCILCGPTLILRFELARVQLVLALSSTIHGPPLPDCDEEEATSDAVTSEGNEDEGEVAAGTSRMTEPPRVLSLDLGKETLTPERLKFRLLEGAAFLLRSFSQRFTSQSQSEIETLELELESNILKVDLYLQQRHALLSSEVAISSMLLLQSSQVILRGPVSERPAGEQDTEDYCATYPLNGECPSAVEASERIGAILWLRCCVALVRSLAAQIFDPAIQLPGKNVAEDAARVLQQGLDVCVRLGVVDTRALLLYEGAQIEAQRGRTGESIALLQEAVRLLQGRTWIPSGSNVILAQATLLLSKLKGADGTKLLKLTQKLVQKQLWVFGEDVAVDDGNIFVSPSGPDNIYLPYFQILYQTSS